MISLLSFFESRLKIGRFKKVPGGISWSLGPMGRLLLARGRKQYCVHAMYFDYGAPSGSTEGWEFVV
jgi:hypothetical protein